MLDSIHYSTATTFDPSLPHGLTDHCECEVCCSSHASSHGHAGVHPSVILTDIVDSQETGVADHLALHLPKELHITRHIALHFCSAVVGEVVTYFKNLSVPSWKGYVQICVCCVCMFERHCEWL